MSGRLFFYSDQIIESPGNRNLDALLLAGHNPAQTRIGFIPSTGDPDRRFFRNKTAYYGQYGVRHLMFFDLYDEFERGKVSELLSCDIIHLSAGDPLQFRRGLLARGLATVLRDYYHAGGTLVGVSGGAVQLGQSTRLFQLFTGSLGGALDPDSDLRTLQLVDFEFLPHFNRWTDAFKNEVATYARSTGIIVYAGNDGDGLIVDGTGMTPVGDIVRISG